MNQRCSFVLTLLEELGETLGGSTKYVIPIQQAIKSFFGPEYVDIIDGEAPKRALGTWAINTLSHGLSHTGSALQECWSSLFEQYEVSSECELMRTLPSSSFIGFLVEELKSANDKTVMDELKKVLGSRVEFGFEYKAHQNILRSGRAY